MENTEIVAKLKLTGSLLELHNENPFKVNSYNSASYKIEKTEVTLSDLNQEQLEHLDGIGKSIAKIIDQLNHQGEFELLNNLLEITPTGVIEMLQIPGVGPKKIGFIWRELGIESTPELLKACQNGDIAKLKGFGQKMQENIIHAVEYKESVQNKFLYSKAEEIALDLLETLKAELKPPLISIAGELRRKMEIIQEVEMVIGTDDLEGLRKKLDTRNDLIQDVPSSGPFCWRGRLQSNPDLALTIWTCKLHNFYNTLVKHTGSTPHLSNLVNGDSLLKALVTQEFKSEEAIYKSIGLPFVEPELREGHFEFAMAEKGELPNLINLQDLRGILHNHSTYSDGKNTLKEMALYCKELGYEYLGISDHSKTAIYANGLEEDRIVKQHQEIDQLNRELVPFKIFKGIESDILIDGSLDYAPEVLETFDFVVASVHSSLTMDEKKANDRLLNAIQNPYTTILGHLTGRLLLKRDGLPLDHKAIIDACAEHQVIIEINANPLRLDLDWRWIPHAVEKGVLISINPDAHRKTQFALMYYGVCSGRKGGLTKSDTFNALGADAVAAFFEERKKRAGSHLP